MANPINYYNALLGKLFNNGLELPLRGGLNFIGVTITPSAYGYDFVFTPVEGGDPGEGLPGGAENSLQYNAGSGYFGGTTWLVAAGGNDLLGSASGRIRSRVLNSDDDLSHDIPSGKAYRFRVNGFDQFTLTNTGADWHGLPLKAVLAIEQNPWGGNLPAASGWLRAVGNTVALAASSATPGIDVKLIGTNTVDRVLIGDSARATGVDFDANTGSFRFKFNGSIAAELTPTALDIAGKGIVDPSFIAFGPTVAPLGKLRFGAGLAASPVPIMYALKADGVTNVPLMRWGAGANGRLHIGDAASGALDSFSIGGYFFQWDINAAQSAIMADVHKFDTLGPITRFQVSATAIDCKTTPITNATTLNGARVIAPTQGANLTDANQTITLSGGANYFVPTNFMTAARVKTIGNTGAGAGVADKAIISVMLMTQLYDVTFNNNSGTGLITIPASSWARVLDFQYDHATLNYVYRGWKPVQ